MTKTVLWVIAGIGGSCLLCAGGIGLLGYKGYSEYTTASQEASAAADKIVIPILKSWDSKLLQQHASAELVSKTPAAEFDAVMKKLNGLFGKFESIDKWSSTNVSAKSTTSGSYTRVHLKANGKFAKRAGEVQVRLRRDKGSTEWKIDSLLVEEP